MKRIILSVLSILFIYHFSWGADGDYRTRQTGNWSDETTWQVEVSGVWQNLEDAAAGSYQHIIPSSSSGIITIDPSKAGHIITILLSSTITVDQLIVSGKTGTFLEVIGTLNIVDGTGNDLTISTGRGAVPVIEVSGTIRINDGAVISGATSSTLKILNGGTYNHNYTNTAGTIYTAQWQTGSILEVTDLSGYSGITAPSGLNQTFYNVTWNCNPGDYIDLDGVLNTTGDLNIQSTGIFLSLGDLNPYTMSIGGNLNISGSSEVYCNFQNGSLSTLTIGGNLNYTSSALFTIADEAPMTINLTGDLIINNSSGTFDFSGFTGNSTAILNLGGNLTITAGTFTNSSAGGGSGTINFNGGIEQIFSNSGTMSGPISLDVLGGTILNVGTSILQGSGDFTLENLAQLKAGSTNTSGAIQTGSFGGNIQVTGARTYSSGSTVIYSGSAKQYIGNGHPSVSGVNTIIDNSFGVDLSTNTTIGGNLTLTNGDLSQAGKTLTVSGDLTLTNGNISVGAGTLTLEGNITPGSNTINVTGSSNLILNGTSITGTFPFPAGTQTINNFTLNRSSGSVTFNQSVIIDGTCTLSHGDLIFDGWTLNLAGTFTSSSGALSGNGSSKLAISSSSASFGTLQFSSAAIRTLSVNGGASVSVGALNIDSLKITNGTLTNSGGLTMNDGGIIFRQPSGSLAGTGVEVAAGQSYNLVYNSGSMTTGLELPGTTSPGDLNNLTINVGSGTVTLDKNVYVNGTVLLSGGSLNDGGFTIHMKGSAWTKGSGMYAPGGGSVSFESASGTTVGGSGTPTLGNITVIGGASLTLPSSTVNIKGNITLNSSSTLNHSNGTINLNGSGNQSLSFLGADAYNISVNKSGGGVSLGSNLNLIGSLDIVTVTTFTSGGKLTLVSTSDGTSGNARIGAIPSGASVSGDVVVQRYMSTGKQYRYITSPVTNGVVSDLQADFPITGIFANPSTGSQLISSSPSFYYYDETTTGDKTLGWTAYPGSGVNSSAASLDVGVGYAAYIVNSSTATTWDLTGPINSGTINFTVTGTPSGTFDAANDGWNLVGNPYPSSIDWNDGTNFTRTNVKNIFYIYDGSTGNNEYYDGDIGSGTLPNSYIATGQAFWVQATNTSPSMSINENAKTTTTGSFFRVAQTSKKQNILSVSLSDGTKSDKAFLTLWPDAKDDIDQFDAFKIDHEKKFNLSFVLDNGYRLCVNYLDPTYLNKIVKLDIKKAPAGSYTFNFNGIESFDPGLGLSLKDNYLNTVTDLRSNPDYSFQINDNPASSGSGRFEIIFNYNYTDDLANQNVLLAYPNPATKWIDIKLKKQEPEQPAKYYIYSTSSYKILLEGILTDDHNQARAHVDISSLNYGLYIVKVEDGKNTYYTKFIKH